MSNTIASISTGAAIKRNLSAAASQRFGHRTKKDMSDFQILGAVSSQIRRENHQNGALRLKRNHGKKFNSETEKMNVCNVKMYGTIKKSRNINMWCSHNESEDVFQKHNKNLWGYVTFFVAHTFIGLTLSTSHAPTFEQYNPTFDSRHITRSCVIFGFLIYFDS